MKTEKTLSDLARLVRGKLVDHARVSGGVSGAVITGVGSPARARPGDITLFSDKRYGLAISRTKASAIVVSEVIDAAIPQIVVQNPKAAFAKILALFTQFPKLPEGKSSHAFCEIGVSLGKEVTLAPFVYVGRNAKIGARCILYPGVYVGADVTIGDDCVIYPNAALYPSTKLGSRVIVHAGTVLGADGFGYVFDGNAHQKIPQMGDLIIEDDVEIGANSAIDRAALDDTTIGQGTKIDNLVQVGHNCAIGPLNILCGQVGLSGGVKTGRAVTFGGQVGVADQLSIPDGAAFGGKSGVTPIQKLKPGRRYVGFPAEEAPVFFRRYALFRKLPQLYNRLKALEKKIAQLLDKRPAV